VIVGLDLSSEPSRPTGVGTYARALTAALARLEEPDLVLETFSPPGLGASGGRLRPTPFGEGRAGARRAFQQAVLPAYARALGVDVLHSVNNLGPLAWTGPLVLSFQDAKLYRAAEGAGLGRRLYRRAMHRWSARGADLVLVASRWSGQEATAALGVASERVRVVPYGVDAARFDPDRADSDRDAAVLRHLGLGERPYVLVVATREPAKNLARAVAAFARACERRPDLRLALCGGRGWGDQDLEGQARRLGVSDKLVPLGYVDDEDLPALYRGCAVFLFPSLVEGFGFPILEAGAAGAAVITSTATACPETAGEGAVLVDPANTEAIAYALGRLLDDDAERAAVAARCRARAQAMTWEATARGTLAVYREACASRA
jgi:glycosyltransferase involved in cell wall biosynthesis